MNTWAAIVWDGESITTEYVQSIWEYVPEDEIVWH